MADAINPPSEEERAQAAVEYLRGRVLGCPVCGGKRLVRESKGLSHFVMSEYPAMDALSVFMPRVPLLLLFCEDCLYVMPFAVAAIEKAMASQRSTPSLRVVPSGDEPEGR